MFIRTTANCLRCIADFVIPIVTIVVYIISEMILPRA